MRLIRTLLSKLLIGIFRFYQIALSPLLPKSCRYQPSCSVYAIQAVRKYGPYKGFALAMKRLSRCHPWGGHGYDPLP